MAGVYVVTPPIYRAQFVRVAEFESIFDAVDYLCTKSIARFTDQQKGVMDQNATTITGRGEVFKHDGWTIVFQPRS